MVGYVWGVFSRRTSWAFALLAAGLAFALQEVLGSIAGWFNIMLGGIYRIGDRIELAGVHGDVIDITPLRTKILEIGGGGSSSTDLWVQGRQATGRIVAISNKTTFDEPAFNYSALFEYVFHEVTFPIGHDADWPARRRSSATQRSRCRGRRRRGKRSTRCGVTTRSRSPTSSRACSSARPTTTWSWRRAS